MKKKSFFTTMVSIALVLMIQNYSYGQCPTPTRGFIKSESRNDSIMTGHKFEKLGKYYAKDLKSVYYNYIADIGSAKSIIIETYHVIDGADPKTFQTMENTNFSYDKLHVYFVGFAIEAANPKNFQPLNNHFSKDNNNIFQGTCKIGGADRDTFKVVGKGYYNYAYDKNYLYFYDDKTEIDIQTFKPKWTSVFEDKNYKYYFINMKIKKVVRCQ